MKRIFLVVIDSFGIGASLDADLFGDSDANTLRSIMQSDKFCAINLGKLGLFNIDGVNPACEIEIKFGKYARLCELSQGKDTVIGHWEIAGIVSESAMPTYPNGFPKEIIDKFHEITGREILCNKPYSGTAVITDYGLESVEKGALIVYTSADSVFQIAAHEDIISVSQLYEYCETARKMLVGEHGVGRVIARPFTGKFPNYIRTSNRHDYALIPPMPTILDKIKNNGLDVIAVGKINDIFASQGITKSIKTKNNADGMSVLDKLQSTDFEGLCFANLVDFDMLYGHRNDVDGYAHAIAKFDTWLGGFIGGMRDDDALIITADHGCDPAYPTTDHTREDVPLLIYYNGIESENLGTINGFTFVSHTISQFLKLDLNEDKYRLIEEAEKVRENSYSPYSKFKVGAALLTKNGKIYTGCNIENAAYTPSICAERTAFGAAISDGERDFSAIAISGGPEYTYPCGVCRQVMREFCESSFKIYVTNSKFQIKEHSLSELFPNSFGPEDIN